MRTYKQTLAAIEKAIAAKTNIGLGMCQANAHLIVGIASDGTPDAATEITAVQRAGELFPITDWDAIPDLAYIVWAGSSHGHIALKAPAKPGVRMVFSPGAPGSVTVQSTWRRVSVEAIKKGWPQHGDPVGWTDTIDGVTVPWMRPKQAPVAPTKPVKPAAKATAKKAAAPATKQATVKPATATTPGTPTPVHRTVYDAVLADLDQAYTAAEGHPIRRRRIRITKKVLASLRGQLLASLS